MAVISTDKNCSVVCTDDWMNDWCCIVTVFVKGLLGLDQHGNGLAFVMNKHHLVLVWCQEWCIWRDVTLCIILKIQQYVFCWQNFSTFALGPCCLVAVDSCDRWWTWLHSFSRKSGLIFKMSQIIFISYNSNTSILLNSLVTGNPNAHKCTIAPYELPLYCMYRLNHVQHTFQSVSLYKHFIGLYLYCATVLQGKQNWNLDLGLC